MKQLLLDSSTNLLYVGLAHKGILIDFTIRIGNNDHSKHLVDRIDYLLKRNDTNIFEIEAIIVGEGPGSYTGLRVSVMVAKMLAYTKKIKLYAVSSLYFLSSGYDFIKAPMIDARNGNVFCAIYDRDEVLLEDGLRKTETLQKIAKEYHAKPVYLDDFNYEIDVINILLRAREIKDVHNFVPNYLRQTEAERND